MPERIRILGVDPGLTHTGWGVIEAQGSALSFVACGTLSTKPTTPLAERLAFLSRGISDVIAQHQPQGAAIEETFVNVNGASTLKLGQARGALLCALALSGLAIGEYAPRSVKKAIVGVGQAEKDQMGMMVRMLLPAARQQLDSVGADAIDALAVAICHAHHAAFAKVG